MFETLDIKNFQSHDDTTLEFHPGVNAIVGPSNNGKSAILRALYWIAENRPLGFGFVSTWNLSSKTGEPKGETRVSLKMRGMILSRYKSPASNSYDFVGRPLSAMGTDVPPEILKALNLTEVNIQKQMDDPFLLKGSSGEVARFLNKTIKLDLIDKVLSTADSKKRTAKTELDVLKRQLPEVEAILSGLVWIEDGEQLLVKCENVESRFKENQELAIDLVNQLVSFGVALTNQRTAEKVLASQTLVEEIDKLKTSVDFFWSDKRRLEKDLENWAAQEAARGVNLGGAEKVLAEIVEIKARMKDQLRSEREQETQIQNWFGAWQDGLKHEKLVGHLPLLQEILELKILIKSTKEQAGEFSEDLRELEALQVDIDEETTLLVNLQGQLPDLCPSCGNPLENHNHD